MADSEAASIDAALAGWDPPPTTVGDPMDGGPAAALAAALDVAPPSTWLPPLWHWLHFLDWPPTGALGRDGHRAGGEFLPPIPERTRMFVGGRLDIAAGLRIGMAARRRSAVVNRSVKTGRSGTMLLLTVRHEIEQGGKVAVVDEQDLMYRSGAPRGRPGPVGAPAVPVVCDAAWQEPFSAGPVVLFRFSALTANSHRIHYDEPYATGIEGYPGLVVHGPLLAVALAGLVARHAPDATMASMSYRFARPVHAGERTLLAGRPGPAGAALAVLGGDGSPSAVADVVMT